MLPHYGDQNSYSGHCRFLLRLPQALNKASQGSEPLLTCEAINKNPGRTAVSCVIWGERPALFLRCWGWHLLWRNTKHMGRGWGAEAPRHTILMPCQQRFLEKKQIQLQRPLWYHCDRIPRLNYCKKQWLHSFYYEIRQWIGMLNCEFTVIVWLDRDSMTLSFLTERKWCIFSIKEKKNQNLSPRGSYIDKLNLPLIPIIHSNGALMNH